MCERSHGPATPESYVSVERLRASGLICSRLQMPGHSLRHHRIFSGM